MSRIAAPARRRFAAVPCAAQPEAMFPLEESQRAGQEPTPGERRTLAVCRGCPELVWCREVMLNLPFGVAGGLTAAQRRMVRARRPGRAGGQLVAGSAA